MSGYYGDQAYVTATNSTAHPMNCATVTTCIVVNSYSPRYRTMAQAEAAAGVAEGRYRLCGACLRIASPEALALYGPARETAARLAAARAARAAAPRPVKAAPVARTAPAAPNHPARTAPAATDGSGAFKANPAGRAAFVKAMSDLIARGEYETVTRRVRDEAPALGARKAGWLDAIKWLADNGAQSDRHWLTLTAITKLGWSL